MYSSHASSQHCHSDDILVQYIFSSQMRNCLGGMGEEQIQFNYRTKGSAEKKGRTLPAIFSVKLIITGYFMEAYSTFPFVT
jgi:hypothetical protein